MRRLKTVPAGILSSKNFLCFLTLFMLFFFISAGTAGAQNKIRVEKSRRKAPEWTRVVPEADKDYLYFVGRATGAGSLEDAESDAAANAVRQIVTAIGIEASVSYDRLRKEADLLLNDRLKMTGDSYIVGVKRLESYHEKQTVEHQDGSVKTTYNAHLLVRYPRQAMEAEIARQQSEAENRLYVARNLLAEALEESKSGSPETVYAKLVEVLETTDRTGVHTRVETARALENIRQRAVDKARSMSFILLKIAVEPVKTVNSHNGSSSFTEALESSFLQMGFQPEKNELSDKLNLLPRVIVSCKAENSSRLDREFFVSHWTSSIRIVSPGDESVIYSEVGSAKGFGPDRERADLDAQRKLRNEVFVLFASEAKDKFVSISSNFH